MRPMARLYRRTDAGRKAWDTQSGQVALEYRRVLGLVGHDTDPRDLGAKLGWSEAALQEILDELEDQGLVRWIEADPDRTDLDFTGKLTLAQLQAAAKEAAREELDFTTPLSIAELRGSQKKTG
jgi:DNA-binding MarR family transcriptional regulator